MFLYTDAFKYKPISFTVALFNNNDNGRDAFLQNNENDLYGFESNNGPIKGYTLKYKILNYIKTTKTLRSI